MATYLLLLNTVPEDGETGVPIEELVRLHVVALDGIALDQTVQVYITRASEGVRRLAYDQADGGFKSPYNGSKSTATVVTSPGSAVQDELWLQIDHTGDYYSLEPVLVEVYASSGSSTHSMYTSYSFIIEDLTAPVIEEILWLGPRKCRLRFDEPLNTASTPGGSAFTTADLGSVEFGPGSTQGVATKLIKLGGTTPLSSWVGYYFTGAGSCYPQNHTPQLITAIDASAKTIQIASLDYKTDDGRDFDEQNNLVRQRTLKGSISPYRFTARLSEEGASEPDYSAEKVQCAYCPIVVAAEVPDAADVPAANDYRQYVTLTLEDDISYGRLYKIHAVKVEDIWDNATTDAELDFQSPWFGAPTDRLKMWANGLIPATDRTDDLQNNQMLRKIVVVIQDVLNMLWQRTDQLQFLNDPDRCPDEWVDYLLYDLANPFRFPLESTEQKRLLAASLSGFYRRVGVEQGIEALLFTLLGINFEITPYVEGDYWTLGTSRLGLTTILGPGEAWARNAYEIASPVDLTDAQRRIVTDVATWGDPYNMHLARITEPSTSSPSIPTYWTLGTSALGLTTTLGGS